jgi:hypothetical protein
MSSSADLAPEAEDSLEILGRQHPLLVSFDLDHIDILCRHPVGLGRPPNFVHRIQAPRYEFGTDDGQFRFFVFFLFGQDEVTLHILDVGWIKYAGGDD